MVEAKKIEKNVLPNVFKRRVGGQEAGGMVKGLLNNAELVNWGIS